MSDFEVCPIGTLQRLAAVEAERDALRPALRAALRMVKEAAIEMRGDDFNLTAEQWAKVHAAIAKAKGGGNG